MRERNYRTHITTSAFTLPVAAALTAFIWMFSGISHLYVWLGLLVTVLTTYIMAESSNRYAMLRVRSRMISTVFLLSMAACPFLHSWEWSFLTMPCWLLSFILFFSTYQKPRPEGSIFYGFLLISMSSLIWLPILMSVPFFLISLGFHLRSLNWRSFCAAVFGLILPYWTLAGYAIWKGNAEEIFSYFSAQIQWETPDYSTISHDEFYSFIVLTTLSLPSIIHYLRTAYNDKIRTRMFFYMLILQDLLLLIGGALQPEQCHLLLRLLIVNSAPIVAHHLTLARGKWAEGWFYICGILLGGLLIFNHLKLWNLL